MTVLPTLTPDMTFEDASRAVLSYLRDSIPMGFWSVTRVENGRQTYLYLDDNDYDLPRGGSHAWEDSFCVRMVAGEAPRVAPDAMAVAAYRETPVASALEIGAYAGAPIFESDGTLFGAICGLDRHARGEWFLEVQPLVELLASLLNVVLTMDRTRRLALASASRSAVEADTDVLTGLLNRRGWNRAVEEEAHWYAAHGDPTAVVMLDLDRLKEVNDRDGHAAGDAYIAAAGRALRGAFTSGDPVARLGGDEFGVIMRGCTERDAARRVGEVLEALRSVGVSSSLGWAPLTVLAGLPQAIEAADQQLYAAKRDRPALPAPRSERQGAA